MATLVAVEVALLVAGLTAARMARRLLRAPAAVGISALVTCGLVIGVWLCARGSNCAWRRQAHLSG